MSRYFTCMSWMYMSIQRSITSIDLWMDCLIHYESWHQCMLKTTLAGNDVNLYKGNIMLNMVVGKWLMVHADECELQDGPMYDSLL